MKKIIGVIIVVAILFFAISSYPFKMKVKDGETHCYNLFNKETSCREPSYP